MPSTAATTSIVIAVVIALVAVVLGAVYTQGYLDPVIEAVGVFIFKAEAKAEEKKLEAQGLKEGQDFLEGELKGNQHADDVLKGIGGFGGLKKF